MIAFVGMLVEPAIKAGISVPEVEEFAIDDPGLLENPDFRKKYLRFWIFLVMQLGRPLPFPTAHWENAKIVYKISRDELKTITPGDLMERGFA